MLLWASLNVNKYQQMYSISSIEEHVIRCKYLICHFKGGSSISENNVLKYF